MSQRVPVVYRETQRFRQWHAAVVLAMPPAAMIFITCRQMIWHHPWGNPPASNGGLIFLCVLLILVYARLLTVRLVTELRPGELRVGLKGLWRRRKIPLDRIRAARVVAYDALRDFGGYGIRSSASGKAYIASGNTGVELELRDGSKVLIGSRQPDELARSIAASRTVLP